VHVCQGVECRVFGVGWGSTSQPLHVTKQPSPACPACYPSSLNVCCGRGCRDPRWIQKHVVPAKEYNKHPGFNSSALGKEVGGWVGVHVCPCTVPVCPAQACTCRVGWGAGQRQGMQALAAAGGFELLGMAARIVREAHQELDSGVAY